MIPAATCHRSYQTSTNRDHSCSCEPNPFADPYTGPPTLTHRQHVRKHHGNWPRAAMLAYARGQRRSKASLIGGVEPAKSSRTYLLNEIELQNGPTKDHCVHYDYRRQSVRQVTISEVLLTLQRRIVTQLRAGRVVGQNEVLRWSAQIRRPAHR